MRPITMITILIALLAVAGPVRADDRWTAEIRAGAALPSSDLDELELDTGFGFEGTVGYRMLTHLWAYAGWDWMHFGADQDIDIEETGYAFGLRFVHPLGADTDLRYILRFGGTYDHIEAENDQGDIVADSDHGLGWEAGLGLAIPVGRQWDLTPGVRYRSLSRELNLAEDKVDADLNYFAVEVGVARAF